MTKVKTIMLQTFNTLAILIINICFVSGLAEESSPEISIFHVDTENKSFRVGNTRCDAKTGVPITIYNVGYVANGQSSQDMADDFLRNNQHLLNTQSASEMESWQITSTRKTGIWTTVRYRQMFDNVPVYDADIAITINELNIVRVVSSKYKKGVHLELDQITPKQTKSDVINKAVQKYGKGNIDNLKYASAEMVIYHGEKGQSKLAWEVGFSIDDDLSEMEAVYEDKTGNILLEVDRTLDKKGGRDKSKMSGSVGVKKDDESKKRLKGKRKAEVTIMTNNVKNPRKEEIEHNPQFDDVFGEDDIISLDVSPTDTIISIFFQAASYLFHQLVVLDITQGFLQTILTSINELFETLILDTSTTTVQTNSPTPRNFIPTPPTGSFPSSNTPPPTFAPIKDVGPIGNIFDPDPLSTAKAKYCDHGFCDNNDMNSVQLTNELVRKELRDIIFVNDHYHLRGPYAQIVDVASPYNGLFQQKDDDFLFRRNDPAFEAVNCYYHVDQMIRYINEDLKLYVMPYHYNGGVKCDPHARTDDNSNYLKGILYFGVGGVDDAEDADVIVHELGHAIHDWITDGGLSQVEGLSEGFGDYLAASYSHSKELYTINDPEYYWLFNWDGHNQFSDGRFINNHLKYPDGITTSVHASGSIWCSCNMKILDSIGRNRSDKAHIMGLSATNSLSNQEDAANEIYLAASDLGYTKEELQLIQQIYLDRGYRIANGVCGDGVKNEFEECDGMDIGDASCMDVSCGDGIPLCKGCMLDYSSCRVADNDIAYELRIKFDNYANETTWVLIRDSDGVIITSGGNGFEYDHLNGQIISESGCLAPQQCYIFEIYDSFGDGICCGSNGFGHYDILVDGTPIEDTKPGFGHSIRHYIGSNCPRLTICGDGILGAYEECDGTDFGRASCADSGCSNGSLLCTADCKIDYSQCTANATELSVEIEIKFDSYPKETNWAIISTVDDITVKSGGGGNQYDSLSGKTIVENFCLVDERCYIFEIYDSIGDGICCSFGDGDYNVYVNNDPLQDTDPDFEYMRFHYFGANCPQLDV